MTIKQLWKVEGDSNEYETEQEALIAESLQNIDGVYLQLYERFKVAKALSEKFILVPIPQAIEAPNADEERELEAEDLDPYDQKDPSLPA